MQKLPPPRGPSPKPSTITHIDEPRFTLREVIYTALAASVVLVAAGLAFFFAQGVDSLASAADRLVTAIMRPIATLALSVMLLGAGIMFLLVGIAAIRDSGSQAAEQEHGE